jgi:hypothetical protein
VLADPFQIVFVKLLQAQQGMVRRVGPDQLVQLDLQRPGIAVLTALDHEHPQERDDRGRGIDHRLPASTVMEHRTGSAPQTGDTAEMNAAGLPASRDMAAAKRRDFLRIDIA